MSRTAELEAELELVKLEDELVAAKGDKKIKADDYRDLKNRVSDARRAYRLTREGGV